MRTQTSRACVRPRLSQQRTTHARHRPRDPLSLSCFRFAARPATDIMPIFVLYAHAEIEGVAKFYPHAEATWTFDVKQGAGDDVRKGVVIDPDEENEVPETKNTVCNFMVKFEGEKKFAYLKVLKPGEPGFPKNLTLRPQTADDGEAMVPIFACECRGMEPVAWTPTGPYCAESESGTVFNDVGFRDGDDWCEYDEKSGESMTVGKDIKYEFKLQR